MNNSKRVGATIVRYGTRQRDAAMVLASLRELSSSGMHSAALRHDPHKSDPFPIRSITAVACHSSTPSGSAQLFRYSNVVTVCRANQLKLCGVV